MAPPQTPSYGFVTLLTSPSYLPGALVLAHALNDLHPQPREKEFETCVLVTPETVDVATIKQLRKAFDRVVGVEVIGSGEAGEEGLGLMGRPDLSSALTKLHIFRLTNLYTKLIYLDADVLPLRPLSHLFSLPNRFSACPDTGWPDCFNSGVMVVEPREEDFVGMMGLMKDALDKGRELGGTVSGNGSFDGADQGLLNEWFSEDGPGGDWNRLSFTYNVTPSAAYTYLPAYKRYGTKIHAVHFIGTNKPWKSISTRPARAPVPDDPSRPLDYPSLVDRWFAVYDKHMRPMGSATSPVTQSFRVPETIAVWNQPALATDQGRMDLEQLKTAAQRGVRFYMGGQTKRAGDEGVYESLPLEGRVDLMRPPPVKPKSPERPPAPSLASSPPVYAQALPAPAPVHPPNERGSPPLAAWDAQKSSPPLTLGPEMKGGMTHVYENAWDRPVSKQHQQEQWDPATGYPQIPESVKHDQWYAGAADVAPERANVKPVFPWEESGRRVAPTRVFPKGDTPPPTPPPQPQETPASLPATSEIPSLALQQPSPLASPAAGPAPPPPPMKNFAEAIASYTNAWDNIPSIQRYVSRLAGPQRGMSLLSGTSSAAQTPTLENPHGFNRDGPLGTAGARRQSKRHEGLETKSEASHDGDDEETDSTDMDDGHDLGPKGPRGSPPGGAGGAGASSGAGSSRPGHNSKRHSDASGRGGNGATSTRQYRERGAQTDPIETRDEQVQVSFSSGAEHCAPHPNNMTARTSPQSSSSHTSSRSGTDTGRATPPRRAGARQFQAPPSAVERKGSSETVTSASSHQLATPTAEEEHNSSATPGLKQQVPVGRVFDPSTSIDTRRRDTVETLTRFMRLGAGGGPPAAR